MYQDPYFLHYNLVLSPIIIVGSEHKNRRRWVRSLWYFINRYETLLLWVEEIEDKFLELELMDKIEITGFALIEPCLNVDNIDIFYVLSFY